MQGTAAADISSFDFTYISRVPLDLGSREEDLLTFYLDQALTNPAALVQNCTAFESEIALLGSLLGDTFSEAVGVAGAACSNALFEQETSIDAMNERMYCKGIRNDFSNVRCHRFVP